MRAALALAARGLGTTWPNPAVGCVLVKNQRVIGRGWTQPGGRPHAETVALERAGSDAEGATAYVSLEPCAHRGKTGPCSEALIGAGVVRVVVAMTDPNPLVNGGGLRKLSANGIAVDVGVLEPLARELNAGFLSTVGKARPLITLKTATSLDGRIAVVSGASKWLTGSAARRRAHLLRAQHDAVMVGVGTAAADNPELTCRLPGLSKRSPVRVVVDSTLRLPLTHKLISTASNTPTWIITLSGGDSVHKNAFRDCGVAILEVGNDEFGQPDISMGVKMMAKRGITRVLVEGGGRLAASLLRAKMVDRLAWFRTPSLIGGNGYPATLAFGVEAIAEMARFRRDCVVELGEDMLETYRIRESV